MRVLPFISSSFSLFRCAHHHPPAFPSTLISRKSTLRLLLLPFKHRSVLRAFYLPCPCLQPSRVSCYRAWRALPGCWQFVACASLPVHVLPVCYIPFIFLDLYLPATPTCSHTSAVLCFWRAGGGGDWRVPLLRNIPAARLAWYVPPHCRRRAGGLHVAAAIVPRSRENNITYPLYLPPAACFCPAHMRVERCRRRRRAPLPALFTCWRLALAPCGR